jgi:hypothetical protein
LLEFNPWSGPENGTNVVALLGLRVTRQHALCNVLAQSQPVIWGHVDELNAIAYLRMLGSDNSIAANHMIFQGQAHTELRSVLYCIEALHVAATETYLLCHGPQRRTSHTCQFNGNLNVDAGITSAFRSLARVSISYGLRAYSQLDAVRTIFGLSSEKTAEISCLGGGRRKDKLYTSSRKSLL